MPEHIYISQIAQGDDSGVDAGNAHSVAWFNTAGNWATTKTAGKIGPGDTVHLVGTLSSQLIVQGSGTAGNVIAILFESGAKMSAPFWDGPAIKVPRRDYITIDGGATGTIGGYKGNPELANGLIECTDNGTELGNQAASSGVGATECNYLTVKNLVISNIYVRVAGLENNRVGVGIGNADTNSHGITNFRVTNCIIHDAYIGVNSDYGPGDNTYEFSYITAYNCNWGGRCGDRTAISTMDGLSVHDCWFHDWTNWDAPTDIGAHHNGFFAWAQSGGVLNRCEFYNNVLGPNFTNALGGYNASTSGLFCQGNVIGPINIYNNIGLLPEGSGGPSNGIITMSSKKLFSGAAFNIFNNTFVGVGNGTAMSLGNGLYDVEAEIAMNVRNNLFVGMKTAIAMLYRTGIVLTSDHNMGFGLASNPFKLASNGMSGGRSLESWQSGTGQDADFLIVDPLLDMDTFALGEGSPAIGAGADLSAFFTTDAAGALRSTPWDIGAFRYGDAPESAAPTITAQPQGASANAGADVTLSVVVSGVPTPALQWQKDGMDIAGATGATLVLAGVTLGDAGTYTCVATNSEGSATSDAAILTVNTPAIGIYRFAGLGLNPMLLLP